MGARLCQGTPPHGVCGCLLSIPGLGCTLPSGSAIDHPKPYWQASEQCAARDHPDPSPQMEALGTAGQGTQAGSGSASNHARLHSALDPCLVAVTMVMGAWTAPPPRKPAGAHRAPRPPFLWPLRPPVGAASVREVSGRRRRRRPLVRLHRVRGRRIRVSAEDVRAGARGGAERPKFLVTAPGIVRPGRNVTIGVELLEHSPSQVTVKVELVKMSASLTVSVLEAEGVFEKGSDFSESSFPRDECEQLAHDQQDHVFLREDENLELYFLPLG
ncbi:uncharacterized protein LOC141578982 [Camelus bactrianus]|uniref:Uncharacterized protein LOC141578982 n=1 Tax=Camelus bactrianus TaxID=9837 RepID=A0AC58R3T1_CAMBA